MDERRSGAGWLGTVITASGEGGSGYTRRSPPPCAKGGAHEKPPSRLETMQPAATRGQNAK